MENTPPLRVLPNPPTARERIALCLIVHNEPRRLERCIESFKPAVGEIVVVHATGATPRSPEIEALCRKHGATYGVYENQGRTLVTGDAISEHAGGLKCGESAYFNTSQWPHVDDFAAARQRSFDLATREWALWADSDDVAGPDFAAGVHELIDRYADEYDAFCLYHNVAGRGIAHNKRERLVRRTAGKWQNRIHENFILTHEPRRVAHCDAPVVVHLPDGEAKQGNERNLRILESIPPEERTVEELYHLHGELMGLGRKQEALDMAKLALRHPGCRDVERYELCLNVAELARPPVIATDSAEYAAMMTALHQAYLTMPNRREALGLLGALHLDLGDVTAAEAYLRAMMALPRPHPIPWTHRDGLYGWAGETLWTQLLRMTGRVEQADAIERARLATQKRPTISVCQPTRGRPEQAAYVRKAWLDAAADASRIEHIFGMEADSPDVEVLGRFRHALAPAGLMGRESGNCVIANNACARAASGQILVFIGDDMGRPPLHWDEQIEADLRPYLGKPAMLAVKDGSRTDDLIVTPIVTRETLAALDYNGGIYSEDYASMFADTELSVRADARGWLVRTPLIIPHDHPAHNPAIPMHETTARNNSRKNYEDGLATFKRRNPDYCAAQPEIIAGMERLINGQ
jgi:hypothetical protein